MYRKLVLFWRKSFLGYLETRLCLKEFVCWEPTYKLFKSLCITGLVAMASPPCFVHSFETHFCRGNPTTGKHMRWLKEKYRSWLSLLFGEGRKSLFGLLVVSLVLFFFNVDLNIKMYSCSINFNDLQFPCPLHKCWVYLRYHLNWYFNDFKDFCLLALICAHFTLV